MEKELVIYGHYGSKNHGNEAYVRGLKEIFINNELVLYSYFPKTDYEFDLNKITVIKEFFNNGEKLDIKRIILAILLRLKFNKKFITSKRLVNFFKEKNRIFMLEAGDQYCEDNDVRALYANINEIINKNSNKITVMLPATIDISRINRELIEDLNNYKLIFARESITFEGLKKLNLKARVVFSPDPAFAMKPKKCKLNSIFERKSVVGITIGKLAQGKEKYTELVYERTNELIDYILNNTNYGVALIPHVNVNEQLTDIEPLMKIAENYSENDCIEFISEKKADMQKYVIGNCDYIVTLRTHVSIAAYSQSIPTLVLGYSQKSKGIAMDLFDTYENYVVNVERFTEEFLLIKSFKWLEDNKDLILNKYSQKLPTYLEKINEIYTEVDKL